MSEKYSDNTGCLGCGVSFSVFYHFYIQTIVEIMIMNFTHKNKSYSIGTINSPDIIILPKTYLLSCSHKLQISVKLHFPTTQA